MAVMLERLTSSMRYGAKIGMMKDRADITNTKLTTAKHKAI